MVVFVREVWGLARSNSAQCRWFGWVTDNGGFRLHSLTSRAVWPKNYVVDLHVRTSMRESEGKENEWLKRAGTLTNS